MRKEIKHHRMKICPVLLFSILHTLLRWKGRSQIHVIQFLYTFKFLYHDLMKTRV